MDQMLQRPRHRPELPKGNLVPGLVDLQEAATAVRTWLPRYWVLAQFRSKVSIESEQGFHPQPLPPTVKFGGARQKNQGTFLASINAIKDIR
jgi:hypothetical protein